MPTNDYFNNFSKRPSGEQDVIERLVTEAIQIMGEDCYYLPRESWNEIDPILGEDIAAKFTS